MTVQISITVWTILCLVALMLILDRLLFRPLLSFMDKRGEKIDRAKADKEAALLKREEALRKLEEERDTALRNAAAEAAANEEKLRGEMSSTVAEAKEQFFHRLQKEKNLLEQESVSIQKDLEPRMEELADLLEVVSAVAAARGSSMDEVEKIRIRKKEKRGGFEKRILLETVTEQDG